MALRAYVQDPCAPPVTPRFIARAINRERNLRKKRGLPPSIAPRARCSLSRKKRNSTLVTILKPLYPPLLEDFAKVLARLKVTRTRSAPLSKNVPPRFKAEVEGLLPKATWAQAESMLPADRSGALVSNCCALRIIVMKVAYGLQWKKIPGWLFGSGQLGFLRFKEWQKLGILDQLFAIIDEGRRQTLLAGLPYATRQTGRTEPT